MNIYLDNAASTRLDPEVFEVMKPSLLEMYGNPSSVHTHGRTLKAEVERGRKMVCDAIGASPAELFFTSGGTEADNMAIHGCVEGLGVKHIISTQIEHHAVTHTIEHLEKLGQIQAHWLDLDSKGNINLNQLENLLSAHPAALVSIMHANNELGTMYDMHAIGKLCKAHSGYFHSDTVQCMGHIPYKLYETPIDFVTASAHKFYGPKGIGFLYVSQDLKIPAYILGGAQERNMRAGTENVASIIGMAYSLKKCYDNLDSKNAHLWGLKNYMKAQLEAHIPDIAFNGETEEGKSIPTILNVAFPCGEEDAMLIFNLDISGISASGGSACTSGSVTGSYVIMTLGHPAGRVMNSVRFSFGPQNTKEEIDFTVKKLVEIINR